MSDLKIWLVGLMLLLVWFTLGLTFEKWAYGVEGYAEIGRKSLYLLPFLAALLVSYFSVEQATLKALLLIVPIIILGPLANLVIEQLGYGTDFPGLKGLQSAFLIFLITALSTVVPGILLGLLMRKIL
ncbi:MAG: hypothetical protein R3D51_17000 [Hyphomicrobiaceae bacterium]